MNKYIIDWTQYAQCARRAVAEGCVLIKNDGVLPLVDKTKISVFGRVQLSYYKGGMGSGGLVNTKYEISILDALENCDNIEVNPTVKQAYEAFVNEHPFDAGHGWATEPWSQVEMPLSDELISKAVTYSNKAIVIIGRTAGEDKDYTIEKGSYYLTDTEEEMLKKVTAAFDNTIVLLNVSGIIDMSWVEKYNPSSVVYVWQGGMEGGNGVLDVLTGAVNPCGRLTDTIATSIEAYPSTKNYGDAKSNVYQEDIYVGYRYFETFAKAEVMYPFGYGLSYTSFLESDFSFEFSKEKLQVTCTVRNIGKCAGKNTVLYFVDAPCGKIAKPSRVLVGYAKTKLLEPNECQECSMTINPYYFSSFDDLGVSGYKFSNVLENGEYKIYVGENVRVAQYAGSFYVDETICYKQVTSALAPTQEFLRIKPEYQVDGDAKILFEKVPTREYSLAERMQEAEEVNCEYTGDKGYKFVDVYDKKVSMDMFLMQLRDEDLRCIVRGEGMNSPRVTPGTAAAFGGVSDRLEGFGIPAACMADGPSGIRMDCGTNSFSLPIGTCLACTFDDELNEELFSFEGAELRQNRVDILLGPGMNIHRNPLNGRNFEYFSEDPLVTGKIAAAQLRGLHNYGVTGGIKHFAANNQECNRHKIDSVVSERALREIYLKGFEYAIKATDAYAIMTTYGALNGIWTAGSYDLCTTILRKEWGFDGLVMTDWWAEVNNEGEAPDKDNLASMCRAGNDVYMVIANPSQNEAIDNLKSSMESGNLSRGTLIGCAKNILNVVMKTPAMRRFINRLSADEIEAMEQISDEMKEVFNLEYQEMHEILRIDGADVDTSRGSSYLIGLNVQYLGNYRVELDYSIDAFDKAQVPVSFYSNGIFFGTQTLKNTDGNVETLVQDIGNFINTYGYVKLFFGVGGIDLKEIRIIAENAAK